MTQPVIRQSKSKFRLVLIAGLAMLSAGCSPWQPVEPEASGETGSVETAAEPKALPWNAPGPGIAVGGSSHSHRYASLKAGDSAVAPEDVGYFVDVHEARLRQVLTGSPIRMRRTGNRILLIIPGNLTFDTDSAEVGSAVKPLLGEIAAVLAEFDKTMVSVLGHTDDRGDVAYNQRLSERRAVAVASILAKSGVATERLVGIGYGQERPAVGGDTEAARTANRRIEIRIETVVAQRQGTSE